jgi:quercetin dioxygenase-like cupin family protein
MTSDGSTFVPDLASETSVPARGILSQTVADRDGVQTILFAMAATEQLSEHTAARPAIIHVLQGSGSLEVDGIVREVGPGAWLAMAPRTPHAVTAASPMVFALYLLSA